MDRSYQLVMRSRSCVVSSRVDRSRPALKASGSGAQPLGNGAGSGCVAQIHQQPRDAVVHELQTAHACLQLGEHHQLHQLRPGQPAEVEVAELVVDARSPSRRGCTSASAANFPRSARRHRTLLHRFHAVDSAKTGQCRRTPWRSRADAPASPGQLSADRSARASVHGARPPRRAAGTLHRALRGLPPTAGRYPRSRGG